MGFERGDCGNEPNDIRDVALPDGGLGWGGDVVPRACEAKEGGQGSAMSVRREAMIDDPRLRRASSTPPTISVVIPALNEAANLAHVLARLRRGVDEVLLVDGLSIDGTVAVAGPCGPTFGSSTRTVRGKGNALACGLAAAPARSS